MKREESNSFSRTFRSSKDSRCNLCNTPCYIVWNRFPFMIANVRLLDFRKIYVVQLFLIIGERERKHSVRQSNSMSPSYQSFIHIQRREGLISAAKLNWHRAEGVNRFKKNNCLFRQMYSHLFRGLYKLALRQVRLFDKEPFLKVLLFLSSLS